MKSRGFTLPGVMGACLLLFVVFLAFQTSLNRQRERLSQIKFQQAARWLAVSGADLGEARLKKGTVREGEVLISPPTQHGRFTVKFKRSQGRLFLVSTGEAGRQRHTVRREIGQ